MTDMKIMIVGVGGQGTLLASRIIGLAAKDSGYDVKLSEVHGMSQRGGSVVTYVKYGDNDIYSPVICEGEADVILSFEQLETARWLKYLKPNGCIVTSDQKINPMPVITGNASYPDELLDKMKLLGIKIISGNAIDIARQAGNEKATNVVMIGMAAEVLGLSKEKLRDAVGQCVPAKAKDINLKAFDLAAER